MNAVDIDLLRNKYLAAFAAAYPMKEPPFLTYEKGWWCFRYRMTGMIPNRYRTHQLQDMLATLHYKAQTP